MRLLYVTSFGQDMYVASGRSLLASFRESKSDGRVLVCYEDALRAQIGAASCVDAYDLATSGFLHQWLHANRDIIPPELGGTARVCKCEAPTNPWAPHRPRCPFQWFNKNASRWFRKVAALEYAKRTQTYDVLVWLDADCLFQKRLSREVYSVLFGKASILYHKSPQRDVVESGVMLFRHDSAADRFLASVIDRFRSGAFRRDLRWDDGYQFQRTLDESPEGEVRDLATLASGTPGMGDVLASGPLGEYLSHQKGTHAKRRIMT